MLCRDVCTGACQWACYGYEGCVAVNGGASGEDAEGKQTEERAVGVACHEVDEMNDAVAAYGMDCDDEDGKQ